MKNRSFLYMAAALLFASCSKDTASEESGLQVGEPLQFSAVSAPASRTMTEVGEDGLLQITWSEGDQVGIYATADGRTASANYAYTATPTKNDATHCCFSAADETQMIYWQGRLKQGFYAYYPYVAVENEEPSVDSHPVTLSAEQRQAVAGSAAHLSEYGVMVAEPVEVEANAVMGGGIQFAFSHIFSVVEFRLKTAPDCTLDKLPIARLKLTSANGVLAYPSAHLNLAAPISSEVAPQLFAEEESASVLLTLGETADLGKDATQSFYMLVAPGNHAADDLKLEITAIDNSVYTVNIAEAVTFRANRHYVREYTLSLDGFEAADPFDVEIPVLTTKVGQPLQVQMSGVANKVDFWSGEVFHDYAYRATDRMMPSTVSMQFEMLLQNGLQREPIAVKFSTDFDGTLTEEAIQKATWTDVSDQFSIPTTLWGVDPGYTFNKSTTEPTLCGPVQCTDWFTGEAESCYVMFHYHIVKNDPDWVDPIIGNKGERGRTYAYFYSIDVEAVPYGQTYTSLYEHKYKITTIDGKKQFPDEEESCKLVYGATIDSGDWGQPASYAYTVNGKSYPYVFRLGTTFRPSVDKDIYLILPKLQRPAATNVGPDTAIAIQTADEFTPAAWSYTFNEAGTYNVVVVGTVTTLAGEQQIVKEYTIEVTE